MNPLIIKPQNESDYELFVSLTKRLKVKYEEQVIDENAPTKEEILRQIQEDYIALKKGTLKTRPLTDIMAELKDEGL